MLFINIAPPIPLTEQTLQEQMPIIRGYVVMTYDRTSCCTSVDDARKGVWNYSHKMAYAALYDLLR